MTEEPNEDEDKKEPESENDAADELPKEFLEAIPAEDRGRVSRVLQMMMTSVGPSKNPITSKITTEHITQVITGGDQRDLRDREDKQRDRLFNGFIFVVSILSVFGLIYLLRDDKELLKTLFTSLLAFGSGFGVGKVTNKTKSDKE